MLLCYDIRDRGFVGNVSAGGSWALYVTTGVSERFSIGMLRCEGWGLRVPYVRSLTEVPVSRFAGKCRDSLSSRKESLTNGEMNGSESEVDTVSRRISFLKKVGLGKTKRETSTEHGSQGPEEDHVEEEQEEVKPREPLSGRTTLSIALSPLSLSSSLSFSLFLSLSLCRSLSLSFSNYSFSLCLSICLSRSLTLMFPLCLSLRGMISCFQMFLGSRESYRDTETEGWRATRPEGVSNSRSSSIIYIYIYIYIYI